MVSNGFTSIIGSGFLAAFALALGANNLQIGLLAATPSITQLIQIGAVLLIEKLRWRKAITVLAWVPAQLLWFPIAAIPFLVPVPSLPAVALLLGMMSVCHTHTTHQPCQPLARQTGHHDRHQEFAV